MKPSKSSKRSQGDDDDRHWPWRVLSRAAKRKKLEKVQAGISTSHINAYANCASEMSRLAR